MKLKSILVSQPQPADGEKSPYIELGKKHNIKVDFFKFIKIEGVDSKEFRRERIHLEDYTALILTSRNAVDHYFRIARELRFEVPENMKYFCLTESTAFYLQKYVQYRKRKIFHGKQEFVELIEVIKKHKNERFLLPCSDITKNDIPKLLEKHAIEHKRVTIYCTVPADLSEINVSTYDMIILFSPVGVQSLFRNFPDFKQDHILIGTVGPATTKAAKDAGLTVNLSAPTKTAPSMTMALEEFIQKNSKKK
ncbi:MAG TPA: uroporphyrinogen-III synthase [Bacteroidales bacterium]|nr:uroporphyrinogen-III synthase [Bacteroidales bacterium]HSA43382.1 uroporphyrinogen-III synthase [Bacteroidales bacterium]